MGDRGNIKVTQSDGSIYLYTHWRGSSVQDVVRTVLARRERWSDAPYLCRMLFCELVKGSEHESTSFGIALHVCDNEHDIVEVHCPTKTVRIYDRDSDRVKSSVTFEQFIA